MNQDAVREYVRGSLWVLPASFLVAALLAGTLLSQVDVGPGSVLAFQGTADDARTVLAGISSTMVTVIALLLGLAVVALQLTSTQFSPRLLRNFLRDRPNQLVLGVFVGTFAYSAAGLFTVGVGGGERTAEFPRFAVTVAIALLFVSLGLLVFFADHLSHSIQIDVIMRTVERNTLSVIRSTMFPSGRQAPEVPASAVSVPSRVFGYVQSVDVRHLLSVASRQQVWVCLVPAVGQHVVAGTPLARIWRGPDAAPPRPAVLAVTEALHQAIRVGFERTLEQDPGFGLRQLVDPACKALSPAVNDPYTAIQAIDHLAVLFSELAVRPLADHVVHDSDGHGLVAVPGRTFGEHLALGIGLIRRYGASEPTVVQALLRLLTSCVFVADDPERWTALEEEGRLILEDAQRTIDQPADLTRLRAHAETLRILLATRRADLAALTGRADDGDQPTAWQSAALSAEREDHDVRDDGRAAD